MRTQEKPGKAYAKVFVKGTLHPVDQEMLSDSPLVLGVRLTQIPLPSSTTAVTCTLNNGIHFVTTPECKLEKETKIEQEFELQVSCLSFADTDICLTIIQDRTLQARVYTNHESTTGSSYLGFDEEFRRCEQK